MNNAADRLSDEAIASLLDVISSFARPPTAITDAIEQGSIKMGKMDVVEHEAWVALSILLNFALICMPLYIRIGTVNAVAVFWFVCLFVCLLVCLSASLLAFLLVSVCLLKRRYCNVKADASNWLVNDSKKELSDQQNRCFCRPQEILFCYFVFRNQKAGRRRKRRQKQLLSMGNRHKTNSISFM